MGVIHRRRDKRVAEAEVKADVAAWISDVMANVDRAGHDDRIKSVLDAWNVVEDIEAPATEAASEASTAELGRLDEARLDEERGKPEPVRRRRARAHSR